MDKLTKHELLVLCAVLGMLLMGWAVKSFRTANLPATVVHNSNAP